MRCESALCVTLALSAYFILACVPLLVRWRWGLLKSLLSTIAALALLAVAGRYAMANWIAPPLPEPSPCGDEGRGLAEAALFFFFPGAAMLAGAALAVLWPVFALGLRFARRGGKP
ncbi:MAG: hypothetical protein ACLPX9_07960 [Rhodomicrobium sp.]